MMSASELTDPADVEKPAGLAGDLDEMGDDIDSDDFDAPEEELDDADLETGEFLDVDDDDADADDDEDEEDDADDSADADYEEDEVEEDLDAVLRARLGTDDDEDDDDEDDDPPTASKAAKAAPATPATVVAGEKDELIVLARQAGEWTCMSCFLIVAKTARNDVCPHCGADR